MKFKQIYIQTIISILIFISIVYAGGGTDTSCSYNFPCTACSGSNNCTSCVSGSNRSSAPPCSCSAGYYSSGTNSNCLKCNDSVCATCVSNATNCTKNCGSTCQTCYTTGSCKSCVTGKYLSNGTCQNCDNSKCATCSLSSTSCVKVCNNDCKTCTTNGTCTSCNTGTYLSSGQCETCNNSVCATCSGSATSCIKACDQGCKTCDTAGSCITCDIGKFLYSSSCIACDNSVCATCIESATTCIKTCNWGCKTCDSLGNCSSCNAGKYLYSQACKECDNTVCATCEINSQNCILGCNTDCKTCSQNQTCQTCHDGTFLKNGSCLICDIQVCATCIISDQNCIQKQTCIDQCYRCQDQNKCLQCLDGWYLSEDQTTCIKCLEKFETCSDLNLGIKCKGNNRSNELPCLCLSGYFDEQLNKSDCQECLQNCLVCDSINNCQECRESYYFDEYQKICKKCPIKYKLCKNEYTGIQCQGKGRDGENFQTCECLENYYENQQVDQKDCILCENPCINCTSQSQCLSCINGYYLKENSCIKCLLRYKQCTNENIGIECQGIGRIMENILTCECTQNYYENLESNQKDCTPCESPCINCTSQTVCLTCISGYYLKENACLKCPLRYKNCISKVQGLECLGLNRLQNLPNCDCKNNFYNLDSQSDCIQCQSPCKNCINQQTCLSCISGTYINGHNCLKCPIQYEQCENETLGISCQGLFRNEPPSCSCIDTYYQKDGIIDCLKCVSPCLNCKSDIECISCIEGYYLKQKQCILCSNKFLKCIDELNGSECKGSNRQTPFCDCKTNYYEQKNSFDCKICVDQCSLCTNSITCINCEDGYYLEDNKCKQCKRQFSKCINAEIGQKCSGNFRQQIIPECPCEEGYYDNGINIDCLICKSPCNTCKFSKISCLTCIEGYYLDYNLCKICNSENQWRQECQFQDSSNTQDNKDAINSTITQNDQKYLKQKKSDNNIIYALGVIIFILWCLLLLIAYYIYVKYIKKQKQIQIEEDKKFKSGENNVSYCNEKSNQGLNELQSQNNIITQISLNTEQQLDVKIDILDLQNNQSTNDIKQDSFNCLQNQINDANEKKSTLDLQNNQSTNDIKQDSFNCQQSQINDAIEKKSTEPNQFQQSQQDMQKFQKPQIKTKKRKSLKKKKKK